MPRRAARRQLPSPAFRIRRVKPAQVATLPLLVVSTLLKQGLVASTKSSSSNGNIDSRAVGSVHALALRPAGSHRLPWMMRGLT